MVTDTDFKLTRGPQGGLCPTQWDKNSQILLPQPNQKAVRKGGFFVWERTQARPLTGTLQAQRKRSAEARKHKQSISHTRVGPFAFVTPAYEKQKPRRTNSGACVVPAGPETYAVSDRTRPKVETISSTISSSTIKGGESARISPVTRIRKPAVLCDLPCNSMVQAGISNLLIFQIPASSREGRPIRLKV